jgi:rod shape-determining protein MreD
MGQQMALIGMLVLVYQLVIVGIDAFLGYHYSNWIPFYSAILSAIFWPWLKLLADDTLRAGSMVH